MVFINPESVRANLTDGKVTSNFDFRRDPLIQRMVAHANADVPYRCNPADFGRNGFASIEVPAAERVVVGAAAPLKETGLPGKLFFALGDGDELHTYGVVKGPQPNVNDKPYVGWIETLPGFERRNRATTLLTAMNAVTRACYGEPLTAGPDSYVLTDGAALQKSLVDRYGLTANDEGIITGQ